MDRKLVQILNGDGMAEAFKQSDIPSDQTLIWREGLAMGPVGQSLFDESTLIRRKMFWETFSDIEENLPDYFKYAVPFFEKISNLENSLIFLWFEHDLFCQVNFMYALSIINPVKLNRVFLVSTDHFEGMEDFKGFGQLDPNQLLQVFESSTYSLNFKEIEFSRIMLDAYAAKEPFHLEKLLAGEFPENIKLLQPALLSHLKRFPSTFNGLGSMEQELINLIHTNKFTRKQLVRAGLMGDSVYGFGDLEFFKTLDRLADYIAIENDIIQLNDLGMKLIDGKTDYWEKEHLPFWLGGSMISNKTNDIRFDHDAGKLVKI